MWMRAFSVQPPSEPGVPAFRAPGSPAIYAARATGFAWIQSFPAALAENVKYHFGFCIAHPSWFLIVHRLCPFALWTVISGLQIGRTLPRVGWAAQRGPVSHVDAGLFCAASLRTRRAPFSAPGSPAIYTARTTGLGVALLE